MRCPSRCSWVELKGGKESIYKTRFARKILHFVHDEHVDKYGVGVILKELSVGISRCMQWCTLII